MYVYLHHFQLECTNICVSSKRNCKMATVFLLSENLNVGSNISSLFGPQGWNIPIPVDKLLWMVHGLVFRRALNQLNIQQTTLSVF